MELSIPRRKFDALEEAEKSILLALGVKVEDPRTHHKSGTPQYIYKVEESCSLCRSSKTSFFLMVGTKELVLSQPLTEEELSAYKDLPVKLRTEKVSRCSYCKEYIRSLERDELEDLVFKVLCL